ncbi:MAG: PaaI family thioesterase [Pelomonas sp.]|nr:PaaI family thioesterase [Roseateles sp.]
MPGTADPLEPLRAVVEKSIPFVAHSGVVVEVLARGHARMRMPLEPNRNHVGSMYAGALFTLAELSGGAIFLSSFDRQRFYPVVRDMSIRFRRPATSDIWVEVRVDEEVVRKVQAEAEAAGKADYEWECELKGADGTVVAITKNSYQLRKVGT